MRANSTAQLGKERCPAQHVDASASLRRADLRQPPRHHVHALSAKLTRKEGQRGGAQEEPRRARTAEGSSSWGAGTAKGHITSWWSPPATGWGTTTHKGKRLRGVMGWGANTVAQGYTYPQVTPRQSSHPIFPLQHTDCAAGLHPADLGNDSSCDGLAPCSPLWPLGPCASLLFPRESLNF